MPWTCKGGTGLAMPPFQVNLPEAATRGAASREKAGGVFGERGRFRPLQGARLPVARPLRGRIHKRDSYCRYRTSLSQRSSNLDNVGRLEAASVPSTSSSGDILLRQVLVEAFRCLRG